MATVTDWKPAGAEPIEQQWMPDGAEPVVSPSTPYLSDTEKMSAIWQESVTGRPISMTHPFLGDEIESIYNETGRDRERLIQDFLAVNATPEAWGVKTPLEAKALVLKRARLEGKRTFGEELADDMLIDALAILPFSPLYDWEKKGYSEAKRRLQESDYGSKYQMTPMGGYSLVQAPLDRDALLGVVQDYELEQARGASIGAAVGKGVAALPSYIVEFGLGASAMNALGVTSLTKLVENKATVSLARKLGTALVQAGVTTSIQPHRVASALVDQEMSGGEGANAVLKAYGATYVENLTELMGASFSSVGVSILDRLPFGGKLLARMKQEATRMGLSEDQFLGKLAQKGGWDGFLGEWGEERMNTVLYSLLSIEDFGAGENAGARDRLIAGLKQDLEAENALVEALVLLTPGGIKMIGNQVSKRMPGNRDIQDALQVLSDAVENEQAQQEESAAQETEVPSETKTTTAAEPAVTPAPGEGGVTAQPGMAAPAETPAPAAEAVPAGAEEAVTPEPEWKTVEIARVKTENEADALVNENVNARLFRREGDEYVVYEDQAVTPPAEESLTAQEGNLPEGYRVFDRGETVKDAYGRTKSVRPEQRYGILTDKGIDSRVYGLTPEGVKAAWTTARAKPRQDTRPEYVKKIESGEGKPEDIQSVASDYLREKFGIPSRSAKSEAEYFTLDDGRRIRLARHSIAYTESDVDLFISIGELPDADAVVSDRANSVRDIQLAVDEAIAKMEKGQQTTTIGQQEQTEGGQPVQRLPAGPAQPEGQSPQVTISEAPAPSGEAVEGVAKASDTANLTDAEVVEPPTTDEVLAQTGGEGPKQVTSARQAMLDEDRSAMGLSGINSKSRRGWQEAMQKAREANIPENAMDIAAQIVANPRPLSDIETAGLVLRLVQVKRKYSELGFAIEHSPKDSVTQELAGRMDRVESEFDLISTALYQSGSEKGRALASQKLTLDQDMSLVSVVRRAKAAKGKELTTEERNRFKQLTSELETKSNMVQQLQQELNELRAKREVKKGGTGTKRYSKMSVDQIRGERTSLLQKIADLMKEGCYDA